MRLFIAIEISEEIKVELKKLVEGLKEAGGDVRWVRPDAIHITLKFFGNADETRKDKIVNILEKISEKKRRFTVTFKGLGAFPDLNRPRVVWAGIERGKEELRDIAGEFDSLLSEEGFPKEKREFSPHLTLGRVRSSRGRKELAEALENYNNFTLPTGWLRLPELTVEKINLMESILKREGAEYRTVVSCKLVSHK